MKMIIVTMKRAEYNWKNRNEEKVKERYEIAEEERDVEFDEFEKAS
jgi:hypothetical protein